jgi:hypothetical protein
MAKELGRHGVRTAELRDERPPADAVRIGSMHGMKGWSSTAWRSGAPGSATSRTGAASPPVTEDPVRHALDVRQERCLLVRACTRARERLRVSQSAAVSELVPAAPETAATGC